MESFLVQQLPFFERQAVAQGKAGQQVAAIKGHRLLQPFKARSTWFDRGVPVLPVGTNQFLEGTDIKVIITESVELNGVPVDKEEWLAPESGRRFILT